MPRFSPRTQCWLEGSHPDVNGKQLALLCSRLKQVGKGRGLLRLCRAYGFRDMGVFIDWASMFQKDPALFDASESALVDQLYNQPCGRHHPDANSSSALLVTQWCVDRPPASGPSGGWCMLPPIGGGTRGAGLASMYRPCKEVLVLNLFRQVL